ncbi:hypothetical protein [Mycobacterium branderi]|uniref:ESX-1 secretion-associated protein n=1 Tax=Mycobacterium branderi TaxID=43348 RepID=A0ABM7KHP1_9MYCO|nr:hypothetical protein [Mycobacterium branderi]MCV7233496.1 hypothetical protein [Mycobacterium branderi]BBZ10613.1 hypothetical protein MBRA_08080 [Mycobacterium branderi]
MDKSSAGELQTSGLQFDSYHYLDLTGVAMAESLSANPDGLLAGSTALNGLSAHVMSIGGQAAGAEQAGAGAASVSEAVQAFTHAFARRVGHRGKSTQAVADAYTRTDDDASTNISTTI